MEQEETFWKNVIKNLKKDINNSKDELFKKMQALEMAEGQLINLKKSS